MRGVVEEMTPGTTTSEIVQVLHQAAKPLTAREIYDAGTFDYQHTVNNGLAQFAKYDDAPVIREKGTLNEYLYHLREGIDLSAWLSPQVATETEETASVSLVEPEKKRGVCPICGGEMMEFSKTCKACYQANKQPKKERPQPARQVAQEPLPAQGHVTSPPILVAMDEGAEITDVEIDPLLVSLVLRLPTGSGVGRWSVEQRIQWEGVFKAALDFLFPDSVV